MKWSRSRLNCSHSTRKPAFQLANCFVFSDQNVINQEINKLRSDQKVLVGQHRDLEFADPIKGFDLNPMSRDEIGVLRTNLPGF